MAMATDDAAAKEGAGDAGDAGDAGGPGDPARDVDADAMATIDDGVAAAEVALGSVACFLENTVAGGYAAAVSASGFVCVGRLSDFDRSA